VKNKDAGRPISVYRWSQPFACEVRKADPRVSTCKVGFSWTVAVSQALRVRTGHHEYRVRAT
jgi:hypothetical protein